MYFAAEARNHGWETRCVTYVMMCTSVWYCLLILVCVSLTLFAQNNRNRALTVFILSCLRVCVCDVDGLRKWRRYGRQRC